MVRREGTIDVQAGSGSLPISYSPLCLKNFEQCELKFFFAAVLRWRTPPTEYTAVGNAVHDALEHLYLLQAEDRDEDTATGYVYGAGVEYAIPADSFLNTFNLLSYIPLFRASGGITVKAEVLHYDLGSRNVLVAPVFAGAGAGSYTARFKTEGNVVRAGFTYRFGGP